MFLNVIGCLCVGFSFFGVQSQRSWGYNSGYNSGFSNSWNSNNGFSVNNNRPSSVNNNNAGNWGSNSFNNIGRPNEKLPNDQNSNWGYETASNTDNWNQNNPSVVSNGSPSWQSDSSRRPNEKKPSNSNQSGSSNWNSNSNTFPSSEDNLSFSPWGSDNSKPSGQSSIQNSNSGGWFPNNAAKENEINTDSDYEDNSISSSWGSNNKKKPKPTTKPFSGSGNRETTTQKNIKNSGTSKWDTNTNKKPQRPSGSNGWDSNISSQPSREESQGNVKPQEEKPSSAIDTSILDELDKNDWYFGKESNYPKPPFQSSLNIDVSELWNFDKNKKSNQNFRGNNNNSNNNKNMGNNSNNNKNNNNNSNNNNKKINNSNNNKNNNNKINNSNNNNNNNKINSSNNNNKINNSNNNNNNKINNSNNNNKNNNKINNSNNPRGNNNNNNNNKRRNRQIKGTATIQCECVNVKLCEEEDMILTQEDIKSDFRPLEEFMCEKLTDVCCTNPKLQLSSRADIDEEKEELRCGESRLYGEPFKGLGDNIAEPGEFPWNLRLENAEFNCSATLIHHKLALTVAHCVTGAQPYELTVTAGIWNSNNEPSQSRKVTQIIPHPDYNSRNPRNDIALLVLETPFQLTDNVNTICLPVTNDKWDSNQCVVAGWKPEEIHGQVLEVLEKGVVNFLPQPECQNIMLVTDLWRNYVFHDSFVCGWEKSGKKSCTGDEGGFVICPSKKRPGTYLQIGIVSKGMNCDEFGRPGIFTNVLKFLDWINKNYFELGLFDDIDIRSLAESQ